MNSTSMSSAVPTIKCEDSPSPSSIVGTDGETTAGAYNLSVNVNLSAAMLNLLTPEAAGATLRTPEIVNDVITMTNPLDQYNYTEKNSSFKSGSGNDSNSSMSNGSSATSPASATPPSIQKTCSDLIKAGLKLSIESKRKMSGSDTDGGMKRFKKEDSDDDYDSSATQQGTKSEGLTPEDEERRRRRRERNKIAATKCRMKKRERTVNLVTESEVLENQNIDLKAQLKDLEVQKRRLVDMLSSHAPSCIKNNGTTRMSPTTSYNMIRPYESQSTFPANYDHNSPYIRPESANILASSYTCVTPINGDSSVDTISSLDTVYLAPQLLDGEYIRPDSVLSLQATQENYVTTDGYLPKATNLLVPIEATEQEYYDPDYMATTQQCHTYPVTITDTQTKLNNGLNDGCLV